MSLSKQFLPSIQEKFTGGVMPVGVCMNWTQPYGEGSKYVYPNYAQWAAGTRSISLAEPTAYSSEIPLATSAVVTSSGVAASATASAASGSGTKSSSSSKAKSASSGVSTATAAADSAASTAASSGARAVKAGLGLAGAAAVGAMLVV